MPILPISSLDLINVVRTPGTLNNATETGSGIDVVLAGNNLVDVSAAAACVFNFTVGFVTGSDIQNRADINWLGALLLIPAGAKITHIRMTARADYSGSTQNAYSRDSGTFEKTCTDNVLISASFPLPSYAPGFITNDFLSISDSAAELTPSTLWNLVSSIGPGSAILRKEWDFTTLPGGSISDTDLYANFTNVGINADGKARLLFSGTTSGSGTCSSSQEGIINLDISSWSMVVTWNYIYQWTMTPTDLSFVQVGDLVTITSSGIDALLLDELTIEMDGIPIVPITQTANELTFLVPVGVSILSPIVATGNGTQFSGSIPLGVLQVLIPETSGIYVLELNKRNDTLYVHNEDSIISTMESAIPNPFIETGFLGG